MFQSLQRWVGTRARFALGLVDYVRGVPPEFWQGPFNNQQGRQAIFKDLVRVCDFSALVETGTFRGDTTDYMHGATNLPVFSVELRWRFYGFARARLRHAARVHLFCMESVPFLQLLSAGSPPVGDQPFFYLDAHWYKSLPIRDELQVVFTRWPRAVVMADDFRVPEDAGYGYDDYGPAGALSLEFLDGLSVAPLGTWFPALPSSDETGPRRGVVVLAKDARRIDELNGLRSLRRYVG